MTELERLEDAYAKVRRNRARRVRHLSRFQLPEEARILEIGCGDGLNLSALRQLHPSMSIVGLDISAKLLARTDRCSPLIQASAYALPLANESLDVVFIDSVFCDLEGFEGVVEEVYRVLKPGGFYCSIEPRHSIARSFFDLLTFSPLSHLLPILHYRRQEHEIDGPILKEWLNNTDAYKRHLISVGFTKIWHYETLLGFMMKMQK